PPGTYTHSLHDALPILNGAGVFYAATLTTGVQNSTAVGKIPVTPEPGTNSTGPASLTGTVQTGGSSGAVSEVVTLSALQTVSIKDRKSTRLNSSHVSIS